MSLPKIFRSKLQFFFLMLSYCFPISAHPSDSLKCPDLFAPHPFLSVEKYLSDPQVVMKYGQPEQFQKLADQSSTRVLIENHRIREIPVTKVKLNAESDQVVWTSPNGDHNFYNEFSWVKYRSNVDGQIKEKVIVGYLLHPAIDSSLIHSGLKHDELEGTAITISSRKSRRFETIAARDLIEIKAIRYDVNESLYKNQIELKRRGPLNLSGINWENEWRLIRYRLIHGQSLFENLLIDDQLIESVDFPIHKDSASTWGIFKVMTRSGPKAIKFVNGAPESEDSGGFKIRDQMIFQLHLAELGASLSVEGVINQNGVKALLSRFPEIRKQSRSNRQDPDWAFVMDYVPEGWNPKPEANRMDAQKPAPWFSRTWEFEEIANQIRKTGWVLDRLGIISSDLQYLYSRSGTAKIFDLEFTSAVTEALATNADPSSNPLSKVNEERNERHLQYLKTLIGDSYENKKTNPFLKKNNLENFATMELQWMALKLIIDEATFPHELRAIAQEKIQYFKEPLNRSLAQNFRDTLLGLEPHLRKLFIKEFVLVTFTDPHFDSEFRRWIENQ
ncbi:MAG: hypothetical protein ACXVCA_02010 [Bdellovibrio sp.]